MKQQAIQIVRDEIANGERRPLGAEEFAAAVESVVRWLVAQADSRRLVNR